MKLTAEQLREIEERAEQATPGPWHMRFLDDSLFMNLVAISTEPETDVHEALPYNDEDKKIRKSLVATTLLQANADVVIPTSVETERWDEDAKFIAASRTDIPRLLAHIKALEDAYLCEVAGIQTLMDLRADQCNQRINAYEEMAKRADERMKMLEEENKNAYEKGRLDEAEITLSNLRMILEYEVPNAHENGHLRTCIRDLEDALKGADNQ